MTASTDNLDSEDSTSESTHSECTQREASLLRVLTYICEIRHRRRTALAVVFVIIFTTIHYIYSIAYTSLFFLLNLISFPLHEFISDLVTFSLITFAVSLILPLIISTVVFVWLIRIFRFR